jgi:hypothetical protein
MNYCLRLFVSSSKKEPILEWEYSAFVHSKKLPTVFRPLWRRSLPQAAALMPWDSRLAVAQGAPELRPELADPN